jgi:hypothetical protein
MAFERLFLDTAGIVKFFATREMRTNLFAAWLSCYSQRRIGSLSFTPKVLSGTP